MNKLRARVLSFLTAIVLVLTLIPALPESLIGADAAFALPNIVPDTDHVYSLDWMFDSCSMISKLDLSSFDTSEVTSMRDLFFNCTSLKTIIVSENRTTANIHDIYRHNKLFIDCKNLIGESGTRFDNSHVNYEYARIDKEGEPGYFSYYYSLTLPDELEIAEDASEDKKAAHVYLRFAKIKLRAKSGKTVVKASDQDRVLSNKDGLFDLFFLISNKTVTGTKTSAKAATCTAAGNKEYYTGSDNNLYVIEDGVFTQTDAESVVIPKKGHNPTHFKANAATCTEAGNSEYYYCSKCGKYFSNKACTNEITLESTVIPAAGHTPAEPIRENETAPTCTDDGSYDEVVYCSVCGEELSRKTVTVEATGHSWGEWETVTEPTYTTKGLEKRVCLNDPDHTETRAIPVLKIKKGDVDGNGVVNMQDYALLQRYLGGWNVEINEDGADMNGDGTVNMSDYALLQRYLAGWTIDFAA